MEGYCSTGQSPQWAVVRMEEEEEEEGGEEEEEEEEEEEVKEEEAYLSCVLMVVYISVDLVNSSVFHHMPDTRPAKNVICLKRKLEGKVNYIYIYIYIYHKLNSLFIIFSYHTS